MVLSALTPCMAFSGQGYCGNRWWDSLSHVASHKRALWEQGRCSAEGRALDRLPSAKDLPLTALALGAEDAEGNGSRARVAMETVNKTVIRQWCACV